MQGAIRGIGGSVIALVGVARVHHRCLIEVIEPKSRLELHLRVAVSANSLCLNFNLLACHQIFDDMRSTILDSSILGRLSCAQEKIHCSNSPIGLHLVEHSPEDLYGRIAVAQVEKDTRRAHGPKGPCGYNIHLSHGSGWPQLLHQIRHLFSCYNAGGAIANAFVDLR
jgi:hypothetical protein